MARNNKPDLFFQKKHFRLVINIIFISLRPVAGKAMDKDTKIGV